MEILLMADPKEPTPSTYDVLYEKLNGPDATAIRKDAQERMKSHDVGGFLGDYVKAQAAGAKYQIEATLHGIEKLDNSVAHAVESGAVKFYGALGGEAGIKDEKSAQEAARAGTYGEALTDSLKVMSDVGRHVAGRDKGGRSR
jgi:hypothetical protein